MVLNVQFSRNYTITWNSTVFLPLPHRRDYNLTNKWGTYKIFIGTKKTHTHTHTQKVTQCMNNFVYNYYTKSYDDMQIKRSNYINIIIWHNITYNNHSHTLDILYTYLSHIYYDHTLPEKKKWLQKCFRFIYIYIQDKTR